MKKEKFLKKHNLTEQDYKDLLMYEEVRQSGKIKVIDYISFMRTFDVNGGEKLARWIVTVNNYEQFLATLEK